MHYLGVVAPAEISALIWQCSKEPKILIGRTQNQEPMKIIPPGKCYKIQFIRQRGKAIKASLVNQQCFISANFSLFVFCWVYNSESLEGLEERLARTSDEID